LEDGAGLEQRQRFPGPSGSMIAGIFPSGLSVMNSADFCSFFEKSIRWTS
jgi:hypothetical protein